MDADELTRLKNDVDYAVSEAMQVDEVRTDIRYIKEALDLLKRVVVDLVDETAEKPSEYEEALDEVERLIDCI